VTAQRGLEIILEKYVDEAISGDGEEPEVAVKKPRRETQLCTLSSTPSKQG
jgi:hypothetical protein